MTVRASETATVPPVVLLVDDNSQKRLALKSVLLPLGYRVVEADSGIAALRCLLEQDFAVILLDVRMPVMDGFETAALARKRDQSEMTPIIFITSHGGDEIAHTDRYSEGAVDFIFAPINPAELRAKVSVFANLYIRAELLAKQAREVQARADQLRLLTDAAPIGIFQTDADNRYVQTNPRWSEITGVSADEAVGRPCGSLAGPETRAHLPADLRDPESFRVDLSHRIEILDPGSPARFVHVTSRAIPDQQGNVAGWVGTLADVTAQAAAEATLAAARDAAVAANEVQKSFAASASHELRTPTTSILGYTEELLESEDLTEQDRGFLDVVYRNAQRLNLLIDDLLILDQAEIGASLMQLEPTAMIPLVERVLSNFAAAAEHAEVTIVTDHEPDPPPAFVDPLRLEQALTNLISNALKFTPHGGEVTVGVHANDETVAVSVADTGIGIDPADIDKIFGRFFRTKTVVDSAAKGSGLGLAIAKRMVEAQNGHMQVTSEVGRGSTFTLTVPVASRELQRA